MKRLLVIAWKELYVTFSDRTAMIFMFAAPLALSLVIGLAFSGLTGDTAPALDITVGIVNLDEGNDQVTYGDIFVQAMVPEDPENPDPDNALFELLDAREMESEEEARSLVESGELAAALFIPSDFTSSLALDQADFSAASEGGEPVATTSVNLTLYWNSGSAFQAGIIHDVVRGIADGIATSNIAIGTTVGGLVESISENPTVGLLMMTDSFSETIGDVQQQSSQPDANPIRIQQVDIGGETSDSNLFAFFAPGIAIFFVGFTVMIGSTSVLQEQRDWTLQRMVTTPTPRPVILAGKMVGTYASGVLQLLLLLVSMAVMSSVLQSGTESLWGNDLLGLALVTLAVVAAGTGLGAIFAGVAKTFEQAQNLGSVVLILMGLGSGVFFDVSMLPEFFTIFRVVSFHTWGKEGYVILGGGGTVVDVLPSVLVLLAMTVVFFAIGLWLFNRRLDV